jgi:hypothetical protein
MEKSIQEKAKEITRCNNIYFINTLNEKEITSANKWVNKIKLEKNSTDIGDFVFLGSNDSGIGTTIFIYSVKFNIYENITDYSRW